MFPIHKNQYLQLKCGSLNPRLINRRVIQAQGLGLPGDIYDTEPALNRLTSEQPDIPIPNVDPTRRPQAFGRLALPKLRRELHDPNEDVVKAAVTSICDLVHDPEKGYEAINLKIPARLADLLLDYEEAIRERAALALTIIAGLADGKDAIVQNNTILENLRMGLVDPDSLVRHQIAACLEMCSRSWMAADYLVDYGFILELLESLDAELPEIMALHLQTLKALMYNKGKCVALKKDAFKIFVDIIDNNYPNDVVQYALDCLMIVASTRGGKKMSLESDLLKILNRLLHYGNTDICTSAASVLMFCTVKTKAKFAAAEIHNLAKRLIHLARNPLNVNLQMFCFQALTNICEHPEVRNEVKEHYWEDLSSIQARTNEPYKETLLGIINWQPSHSY